jgi:hypothetical protein
LATSPSCPTGTTTSSGANRKRSKIGPFYQSLPPFGRDGRTRTGEHRVEMRMATLDLLDPLAPRLEEEARLIARGVARNQQFIVGLARDEDDAGGDGGHRVMPQRVSIAGGALRNSPSTAGEQIGRHVDMLDRLQLAGKLVRGEAEQHGRRQIAIDCDMRGLGLDLCALDRTDTIGLGRRFHRLRFGQAGRAAAGIVGFFRDQQFLAPGEFGLGRQFVLGDRALFLDRQRTTLERRLVGFLLERLERRRLERALQLARRERDW